MIEYSHRTVYIHICTEWILDTVEQGHGITIQWIISILMHHAQGI